MCRLTREIAACGSRSVSFHFKDNIMPAAWSRAVLPVVLEGLSPDRRHFGSRQWLDDPV